MEKTVVVTKGTSVGMTTFMLETQGFIALDDVSNVFFLVGESLKEPFKKEVYFRRYHAVPATSFDVKPRKKTPNFARFQNDFSNRRSYKKL